MIPPRAVKFFVLSVLAAASAFIWTIVFAGAGKDLSVSFLNIGQGDSILTVWTLFTPMSLELGSLT